MIVQKMGELGYRKDINQVEEQLEIADRGMAAAMVAQQRFAGPLVGCGDCCAEAAGARGAKVLGAVKGPKIRIGKYKKRTGYRKHTGFRASLTQIQIESIGGKPARATAKSKAEPEEAPKQIPTAPAATTISELPAGFAEMTVAEIKASARGWDSGALEAALAYEQEHGKRKGAIAALESARAHQEGES